MAETTTVATEADIQAAIYAQPIYVWVQMGLADAPRLVRSQVSGMCAVEVQYLDGRTVQFPCHFPHAHDDITAFLLLATTAIVRAANG